MATITHYFDARQAEFRSTTFPAFVKANGTAIPVPGLAFDTTTAESCFFYFRALNYGSGNLTVDVDWYADTATSGGVVWGCQIAALTPNTDTQDIETDALTTQQTAADTHLGTVGQRLHRISVTVSNLDSIAVDDYVVLCLARVPGNASDTMTGDAIVVGVALSYSDV